jgi:hypothetical protein
VRRVGLVVWVLVALLLALGAALYYSDPARSHGANVREARQWARDHMNDRNWRCLDRLIEVESGWYPRARNPVTGAYGLPQALPATKMAVMGPGWRWMAVKQVRWVVKRYIRAGSRYGNACDAWRSVLWRGWY